MSKIWKLYVHTNKINNKKYIGITSKDNVNDRWCDGKNYKEQLFGKAIKKYGWDGFYHEVLKVGEKEEIQKLEKEYIEKWNTKVPYGYNVSDGGELSNNGALSTVIYVYDREYNLIKRNESISECEELFSIPTSTIIRRCNKGFMDDGNLLYSYTKVSPNFDEKIKLSSDKRFDYIFQYNKNAELVKIWTDINDCVQSGFGKGSLRNCFDKNRKQMEYKGFVWSKKPLREKELISIIQTKTKNKKVYQYSKTGALVKEWNSMEECEENGFDKYKIMDVLKKKKKFYNGFYWSGSLLCESDIERVIKYKDTLKKIYQYNKDTMTFLKEWDNVDECVSFGYTKRSIIDCCNGKVKSHKGCIWSFSELV